MRQHTCKSQTFSIPIDISIEFHALVKRSEMSRFVSDAIRKELKIMKEHLRRAYRKANKDAGQLEALEDWGMTISDGLDK